MLATQARLLIVDSDRDAVRALANALHPFGVAAGAVADPDEAVSGVVRFGANLVIVASELGGGRNGVHYVHKLARDPRTLHLPVVLLTGRPRGDEVLDALRAGAADYLVKPVRPEVDLPSLLELAGMHPAPGAPFAPPAAERLVRIMKRLMLSAELSSGDPDHMARFEGGQLTAARSGAMTGEAALEALLHEPEVAFRAVQSSKPSTTLSAMTAIPVVHEDTPEPNEIEIVVEQTEAPRLLKCLLVDDEPDLLKLFSAFLKRAGFEVTTANDGLQGYEAAQRLKPDVVVADLNMPHLDGWGLLRKLRTDVALAETPVVFLSAQDDYRESLRAVGAGAQDYLAKAQKMDVLAKRVRLVLEPRERAALQIAQGAGVQARVEQLGVRWLLGELAKHQRSGTVAFADGMGVYNVGLQDGVAVFAAAQTGNNRISALDALKALGQLRAGDAQYLPQSPPPAANLRPEPLVPLMERLAGEANKAQDEALEAVMVRAVGIEVDPTVFSLYVRFCPPFGRDVAGFIKAGMSPKAMLAETSLNPVELLETLRDMVRRNVIRLKA